MNDEAQCAVDLEKRFSETVRTYQMTCSACPTQYEGTLHDGRIFYFRYRHGLASLGLSSTSDIMDAVDDSFHRPTVIHSNNRLDGEVSETEFKALMLTLMTMRSQ